MGMAQEIIALLICTRHRRRFASRSYGFSKRGGCSNAESEREPIVSRTHLLQIPTRTCGENVWGIRKAPES